MAYQVPTEIPSSLASGDTWTWSRSYGDYPQSEGWVLVAHVVGDTERLDVTSTGSGTAWTFSANAIATAGLTAGNYRVTVRATRNAEARTVEVARTVVSPAAGTIAPGAELTPNERLVKAYEAELERRLTGNAVASYSIAGRSLTYESMSELRRGLAFARAAVKGARTGLFGTPVFAHFTNTQTTPTP